MNEYTEISDCPKCGQPMFIHGTESIGYKLVFGNPIECIISQIEETCTKCDHKSRYEEYESIS